MDASRRSATTVLVTGGAGYIGSHVAHQLAEGGWRVVVLDDLSTGRREFVPPDAELVEGSVTDAELLHGLLAERRIDAVAHLAALKWAGVSVDRPLEFFHVNVEGTRVLLEAMLANDVSALVFSSSCAVYGTPADGEVTDESPLAPESPYGQTKVAAEWLVEASAHAGRLEHTSLRYFNVAGSGFEGLYDTSPYNLFPRMLAAISRGEAPVVYGTDYPTPDGSCVRDYVHVSDIARAHVVVLERLMAGEPCATHYCLGSGSGYSVLEVLEVARRVTGSELEPVRSPRRAGDPSRVVSSSERIERELGWRPELGLEEMVASAWLEWARRVALSSAE